MKYFFSFSLFIFICYFLWFSAFSFGSNISKLLLFICRRFAILFVAVIYFICFWLNNNKISISETLLCIFTLFLRRNMLKNLTCCHVIYVFSWFLVDFFIGYWDLINLI